MRSVNQIPKYHGLFAKPEDYFELENDGFRYELIHGRLVVAPSPVPEHQTVLLDVVMLIRNFLNTKPMGKIYVAPLDVHIGNEIYQPDILFIDNENKDVDITSHINGAPDLVVEILSPSTAENDYGVKFDTYEKYGVKEYWIIDQTIKCDFFVSVDGKFKSKQAIDNVYHSIVLAGFALNIDELKRW